MEGNPRRVLDLWAGVAGVELERFMTSSGCGEGGRGEGEHGGRGGSLYITIIAITDLCVIHDGQKQQTRNDRRVSSTRHPDTLQKLRNMLK